MATFKKRIEYIASTNEHPARFTITDLPYTGEAGDVFTYETEFKYIVNTDTNFASWEGYVAHAGYYWYVTPNGTDLKLGPNATTLASLSTANYQTLKLVRDKASGVDCYINGSLVGTRTDGFSENYPCTDLILFGGQGSINTYFCYQYKKSVKLWHNNVLIHDYIPVLDNNDVPCWFDRVSKELLYADEGYTPTVYGDEVPMYANQVEYIGSNNNARFTISNLGVTTSKNLLIETPIKWLNYPNSINGEYRLDLVGGWQGANSSGKWILASGVAGSSVSTTDFQNVKFKLDNTNSKTSILIDDTEVVYRTTNPLEVNYVNVFYGTYGATTYYANNLKKYIKVFVDNELKYDYIPVVDIDGVPAFYDKISNTMLYADAGYVPTIVGGVVDYEFSNYLRERQLLIANKTILPYYCELEYISYPTKFLYAINSDIGATATSVIEIETEIKYLGSLGGGVQLEGNGSAGRWYGINAEGNYTLGGGVISTTPASTTTFDKIKDIQDCNTAVNTLFVNGVQLLQRTSMNTGFPITMAMFTDGSGASYQFNVAKKYHKVWVDGKLVYDWIPVLDYNRVPCWYNRVNGAFLYAYSGDTPTVWGREIHPIPRIHKERLLNYDLGASPLDVTDSIEMKFLRDDPSLTNILFRQAETVGDTITKLTTTSVSNKYFASSWFYDGSSGSGNTFSAMDYDIPTELVMKSGTIIVDGVSDILSNTGTSLPSGNFYLFGLPSNSSKFFGYFYYFRIRSAGGTLKMNIIPIVDETGTPYLWDSVSRTILTPSGSGALSYDDILLESIENKVLTDSNTGGPYIHLPVMVKEDVEMKARLFFTDSSTTRYCFGNGYCYVAHYSNNDTKFLYGNNGVTISQSTPTIRLGKKQTKNYINDVEVTSNTENEFTANVVLSLFTSSSLKNGMVGGYNYFYFKSNGEEYNLVPTIRNGTIGMVNTLDGTMYPNLRSGVDFFPNFLPQFNKFNALDNLTYWEWEIDTRLLDANNKTFGFYQNTPNFDIDWGDNNYEVGQTSHTYATAGKYTIRIYKKGTLGRFYWYDASTPNQYGVCVTAVNTPMPMINQPDLSQCFRGCTNLTKVCDNFFVNNRHATYVNYFFYECPLDYIPKNILKGMYVLGSVTGLFAKTNISEVPVDLFDDVKTNCTITACFSVTKIKTLPAHLIDRLVDCTNASQFVNQCTELEYLPDLFFQYQTKVVNWRYLAYGNTKFKLNANLFCNEATDIATRFAGLSSLDFTGAFSRLSYTGTEQGTAPQLWNYTYTDTPTTTGCYSGAGNSTTSLSNYASIPSTWGGPLE